MRHGKWIAASLVPAAFVLGLRTPAPALDPATWKPRPFAGDRTGCTDLTLMQVGIRARNTPFVGETLDLEITVRNGPVPGPYRWRVFGMRGGLDFGEVTPEWSATLAAHETKVTRLACRVTTTDPFFVVGILEGADGHERPPVPAQGVLQLFPFEASGGGIVAHWDPRTQRPLPKPGVPDPYMQLPGGGSARVLRFGMEGDVRRKGDEF